MCRLIRQLLTPLQNTFPSPANLNHRMPYHLPAGQLRLPVEESNTCSVMTYSLDEQEVQREGLKAEHCVCDAGQLPADAKYCGEGGSVPA
jgi:hypothetical protein